MITNFVLHIINVDYRFRDYPRKTEIQNMLRTKLFSFSTVACKLLKLINVVVAITPHSQQLEQQVLKD
jgi:hypothetical protein